MVTTFTNITNDSAFNINGRFLIDDQVDSQTCEQSQD